MNLTHKEVVKLIRKTVADNPELQFGEGGLALFDTVSLIYGKIFEDLFRCEAWEEDGTAESEQTALCLFLAIVEDSPLWYHRWNYRKPEVKCVSR
jgi:hypothetical protein